MEFQTMKRRELQALCKRNNIPANLTNAAMSHSLSLLPFVEGLDELLRNPTASEPGSPESSVISTPAPSRTSTRPRVTRQETEGSILPSRTRYGTRSRAVGGTETGKTPATRTTRTKVSRKQTETDMQAAFEADMDQSEVSDNNALLGQVQEISEAVSALSMKCVEPILERQQESEVRDVVNNAQVVINLDDDEDDEDQQDITEGLNNNQKVAFHTLPRRDLQSLCKKNKIPANTSNATMADALESLAIVEGLEEFLQECNSEAPDSPTMSEMTSSCARRTWTSRKITKEPTSSKLLTKSCRASRKTVIENIAQEMTTMSENLDVVVQEKITMSESLDVVLEQATLSETVDAVIVPDESEPSVIEAADMEKPEVLGFTSETTMSETQEVVTNSVENKLSVIEAVETEKLEVIGETKRSEDLESIEETKPVEIKQSVIVSDTINGDHGFFNEENFKQLEQSETENDAYSGEMQLEVPEQLQIIGSAGESKNTEVFGDDMGSESESEDDDMGSDCESEDDDMESECESEDDDMESECESDDDEGTTTDGSETEGETDAGSDLCLVKKLEGAEEDHQFTKTNDTVVASLTDEAPVFEENAETDMAMDLNSSESAAQKNAEKGLEISPAKVMVSSGSDLAAQPAPSVQVESNNGEEENVEKLESLVNKTPLVKKSMRKLKVMLKEKLQEANSLANQLGNLTLDEKVVTLTKVEEGVDEEGNGPEVVSDVQGLAEKNSSITPSEAPISVAGSDINKENFETEPAKLPGARSGNLPTDMSMIKLKKALQQSGKRPALHKLSDNCHPLASPVGKLSVALAGETTDSSTTELQI